MASRPNTTQTQGAIGQLELPSGKYAEINDINPTLRTKARDAPNPILPRAAGRRAWPATIREREPLVSSLIGSGRAGKQGRLAGSKGSLYEGGVLAGRPHGWGQYYVQPAPDVRPKLVYEGEWVKGIREGTGTYYYANGEVYNGQWQRNQRNGQGMLHYSNGDVYEGSWVGDQRHGAGTFTSCSSGAIFVGSYCQGLRQGLGTLYMPTKGKKYVAEYVNDAPVCGSMLDIDSEDLRLLPISHRLSATIKASTLNATLALGEPHPLPVIRLAQPDKVLEGEVVRHRKQQECAQGSLTATSGVAGVTATHSGSPSPSATSSRTTATASTSSSSSSGRPAGGGAGGLFCTALSADEISLLRHAFILLAGGDDREAHVQPRQLTELVVLAGRDPATATSRTLVARWQQLAKGPDQHISLDSFLHVALHYLERNGVAQAAEEAAEGDEEADAAGDAAFQIEQTLTMQHQAYQQLKTGRQQQPLDDPLLYGDGGNYDDPPAEGMFQEGQEVYYGQQEEWEQVEQQQSDQQQQEETWQVGEQEPEEVDLQQPEQQQAGEEEQVMQQQDTSEAVAIEQQPLEEGQQLQVEAAGVTEEEAAGVTEVTSVVDRPQDAEQQQQQEQEQEEEDPQQQQQQQEASDGANHSSQPAEEEEAAAADGSSAAAVRPRSVKPDLEGPLADAAQADAADEAAVPAADAAPAATAEEATPDAETSQGAAQADAAVEAAVPAADAVQAGSAEEATSAAGSCQDAATTAGETAPAADSSQDAAPASAEAAPAADAVQAPTAEEATTPAADASQDAAAADESAAAVVAGQ